MGIYDREYYQDETGGRGGLGGDRMMVTNIILVNVAVYVINMFTSTVDHPNWLMNAMAVPSDLFLHPWDAWKLVTAGFAHAPLNAPHGLMHILANMYALWVFGRDVEMKYGRAEFLRLYLGLVVLASLCWVTVTWFLAGKGQPVIPMLGASGAVSGMVVLFALNFPNRRFAFPPAPAWVVGILFVGLDILGAMGRGRGQVAYSAHLGGAFFGFLYFWSGIRLNRWTLPTQWLKRRSRPKLRVVDSDDHYTDLDTKADQILKKMHTTGLESLTPQERRTLEDYSRRMRQKHR